MVQTGLGTISEIFIQTCQVGGARRKLFLQSAQGSPP